MAASLSERRRHIDHEVYPTWARLTYGCFIVMIMYAASLMPSALHDYHCPPPPQDVTHPSAAGLATLVLGFPLTPFFVISTVLFIANIARLVRPSRWLTLLALGLPSLLLLTYLARSGLTSCR